MSHPVVPTDFPATPALGDIHTTTEGARWEWTNIGWVKREIVLNHVNPVYDGKLVNQT